MHDLIAMELADVKKVSKACDVNFCRTLISRILLFLELAGSSLTHTLLNPSKVIWHRLFLSNVSVVSVNTKNVTFRRESFS